MLHVLWHLLRTTSLLVGYITHRLILRALIGGNTLRGTKSDGACEAIPVAQFDILRPFLLTKENKKGSHFFRF